MRRQILFLTMTLLCLKLSSQQYSSHWQWLNPKPSGFNNNNICFSDSSNGFIFTDGGELIHTTDGGEHWTIQQRFFNATVMDIHDSTGIIAGSSNAIYVSTDNGDSWQKKVVTTNYNPYFQFVRAVSRDTLLALNSNNSSLYRSIDRGMTWSVILSNVVLNNNLSFHFVNSKTGFLGNYAGIQKTNNGGISWQTVYSGYGGILAIHFLSETVGYAYRSNHSILKTTDGGLTWNASSFNYFDIFSFFHINSSIIYAAGENYFYKTTDGGVNWSVVSPPSESGGYRFNAIHFVNDRKGFVVGTSGKILSTSDGGLTWKQYGITHLDITTLRFPSTQVGYATDWLSVYKTVDKGQNWQPANLTLTNQNSWFTHSWFQNKDSGFIISKSPALFYKTKDGGQTWQVSNPLPWGYDYALDLDFVSNTTGYLCMYNSTWACQLFKTNDGGETWNYIGVSYDIFKRIDFVNGKTGYGVTDHKILKTVDSAKTWLPVLENSSDQFNGVHFINEATGYSFGDNGLMKKTIDSGATWSNVPMPYTHILNAYFFNEQVGYITGDTYNNGILKTYDGGNTWHKEFPLILKTFVSTADTTMYNAGSRGKIVSQAISGYNLDSVLIKNITPCSADFSAYLSVAFGSLDSIRVEYGRSGFTNHILLTPSSVANNTVKLVKSLHNLEQDSIYYYRLHFVYKGTHIYSDEGFFRTLPLPKPTITVIRDTLISSANNNNQWFLNGQPIAGANGKYLKATASGNYTVQVTEQGCLSEISNVISYVVTSIDQVLAREVTLFPNPNSENLYIKNNTSKILEYIITDLYGHELYSTKSNASMVLIPFKNLSTGVYLVTIKENGNKSSVTKKIIKQ